jgi:radical SAM protein with 4Fe4S-binding SPASM domain
MMDEEFLLGNVKETGLRAVQDCLRLRELAESCVRRASKIEKCRDCRWRNLCQGACAAHVFLEKGTLWATDPFCEFRKTLYGDLIFKTGESRMGTGR